MHSPDNPSRPQVSRRAVAGGAAWAIPTIMLSAAAPAVAASPTCIPSLSTPGGLAYDWGIVGANTTTQVMNVSGGNVIVNGLPDGVYVTDIQRVMWIENRIGQDSVGPGAFFIGNSTVNRAALGTVTGTSPNFTITPRTPTPNTTVSGSGASQFTITNPYPVAGTGYDRTVRTTANMVDTVMRDGTTRKAWNIIFDWTRPSDSTTRQYTTQASGCHRFESGWAGSFNITYNGVKAPTRNDQFPAPLTRSEITVTLSNGEVLRRVSFS